MIGDWAVPSIERIRALENRRLAVLGVPGLVGDLHHDLGSTSIVVEMIGSVHGDTARDNLLAALRGPFQAGDPVSFVADITTATALEKVLIDALEVSESNDGAGVRYRVVLRQYVEPPPPPAPIDDLGAGLDVELDALAGLGLDGLELPDLVGGIPDLADPTPPVQQALNGVRAAVAPLSDLLAGLAEKLG
jgi:hypothetical protein